MVRETVLVAQFPRKVALHDIQDVDGFVGAVIARDPVLRLARGYEREELECEAFSILCELANDHRPGRASFSTRAGRLLPLRLRSAWHRMHPGEHRRPRGEDGSRPWVIGPAVASWDAELERPAFSECRVRRLGDFAPVPVAA